MPFFNPEVRLGCFSRARAPSPPVTSSRCAHAEYHDRRRDSSAHSLDWSVAPTQSARIAARLTRRDAGHANRRGVRARAASPHWRTSARRARRPRGSSAPAGARPALERKPINYYWFL